VKRAGFTLVEVMVAVAAIGLAIVPALAARNQALAMAVEARNLSVVSRLAVQLLHRIEAGRVPDLFDGYSGDFTEEGFPQITYVLGIGDASNYTSGIGEDDAEQAWRRLAEETWRNREDAEDELENKPLKTRVFLSIQYEGGDGEPREYLVETLVPTWAVEQDFEMWEELWGGNLPEEIR